MGQMMGSYEARKVGLYMDDQPTFDPQAGFDYQRKPRGNSFKINALVSSYHFTQFSMFLKRI